MQGNSQESNLETDNRFHPGICLQGNKLMLVLCLSTTTMAIGFAVRIPMTANPYSLGVYIVTTLVSTSPPNGNVMGTWIDPT